MDQDLYFEEQENSLFAATFQTDRRGQRVDYPSKATLNTLSTISGLYLYNNPPPYGYGTPAPKVAESIIRAYSFNRKENNRIRQIGRYQVNVPYYEDNESPYPFDSTTGNFHPGAAVSMFTNFLHDNYFEYQQCVTEAIDRARSTNSDIITQGKQAWCPLTESSIPCSQAYSNMSDFYKNNGLKPGYNCIEWIQSFFECCNMTTLRIKRKVYYMETKSKRAVGQMLKIGRKKSRIIDEVIRGESCFDYMMDLARSFCSYIKHGERGKLKRRAIASANVILRMFLHIVEDVHLRFGKTLRGSTISIGGEEKKAKIIKCLNEAHIGEDMQIHLQATQDVTKWNECLSADLFALFNEVMHNIEYRHNNALPASTENEKIYSQIAKSGHFILATKMITLGEGLQGTFEDVHNKIDFVEKNMSRFNSNTREWFSQITDKLYGNNYCMASPGMLMGMHNALSTTVALTASGWRNKDGVHVVTLRSSDDSTTQFSAVDTVKSEIAIKKDFFFHKLIGVNYSPKKCLIFRKGFSEYTSWYQDMTFVAQYGIESTTMRPGGKNPHDDFYAIAKSTCTSMSRLETNAYGAEFKLRIGIGNVRRLYRIEDGAGKRAMVSRKVLLLSDGGFNPWCAANCHLEETSLKEICITNEMERDYLNKVRDPNNPFSCDPEDDVAWSKDSGCLVVTKAEIPSTVFRYVRKSNRSITNSTGPSHAEEEKANHEALSIVRTSDPSFYLKSSASTGPMNMHVIAMVRNLAGDCDLTPEEKLKLDRCILKLNGGVVDYKGETDEEGEFSDESD